MESSQGADYILSMSAAHPAQPVLFIMYRIEGNKFCGILFLVDIVVEIGSVGEI